MLYFPRLALVTTSIDIWEMVFLTEGSSSSLVNLLISYTISYDTDLPSGHHLECT